MRWSTGLVIAVFLGVCPARAVSEQPLRIAPFCVDASPPLGSPVAYTRAGKIEDPLSARGVVFLGAGKPVVLCAVDWIEIGNDAHDEWCAKLAEAAGTTPDRVAVHTLHQHDAPRCEFAAEELLAAHGLRGKRYDTAFARRTIEKTADAIRQAVQKARPVTHLGVGEARVEKVASNRRILGPDGKVKIWRASATKDPAAIAAPEGLIDPVLKLLSFWDGDHPIVCLSYYATHPMSYYGSGDVTPDFVGLARAQREKELGGLLDVHFNGASGNIAAGKYNDGSHKMRPVLAQRMADGFRKAWEATKKTPIAATDVDWRVRPVKLPPAKHLVAETLQKTLADPAVDESLRTWAAGQLVFLDRIRQGRQIELSCLRLKNVYILHMPGECFIEYQLAAQRMKPKATVCMAAYGDYGPWYIGTAAAYAQGSYEVGPTSSNVAPEVEGVLMQGVRELLGD